MSIPNRAGDNTSPRPIPLPGNNLTPSAIPCPHRIQLVPSACTAVSACTVRQHGARGEGGAGVRWQGAQALGIPCRDGNNGESFHLHSKGEGYA